jgi:hypothetical protein
MRSRLLFRGTLTKAASNSRRRLAAISAHPSAHSVATHQSGGCHKTMRKARDIRITFSFVTFFLATARHSMARAHTKRFIFLHSRSSRTVLHGQAPAEHYTYIHNLHGEGAKERDTPQSDRVRRISGLSGFYYIGSIQQHG